MATNRINLGRVIGVQGERGPQGPAGNNGANGITPHIENGTWWLGSTDTGVTAKGNEWFSGAEIPTVEGVDGDLYLRTTTSDVYKKESGVWVLKTNIKGSQGEQGVQGENATSIEMGTITTLDSDQDATAELVPLGDGAYQLNLGIPKGEQGAHGEAGGTTISIGGFVVTNVSFSSNPQEQLDSKIDMQQDAEDVGKYLIVGADGIIRPSNTDAENDVIEGYYYNGVFYEDVGHETAIVGANGKIYIDLSENTQYRYANGEYIALTSGGSAELEVVEVEGVVGHSSDMTPEYEITFTLPSDFDLTSVKEYLFKLTTQTSWVGVTSARVFVKKGSTTINILTPYNSGVSYADIEDLAQVFNNSNGWEFKGIMQSNGLLVEMDNLTSVRAEIGNIDTLLTTLNSGGGV